MVSTLVVYLFSPYRERTGNTPVDVALAYPCARSSCNISCRDPGPFSHISVSWIDSKLFSDSFIGPNRAWLSCVSTTLERTCHETCYILVVKLQETPSIFLLITLSRPKSSDMEHQVRPHLEILHEARAVHSCFSSIL